MTRSHAAEALSTSNWRDEGFGVEPAPKVEENFWTSMDSPDSIDAFALPTWIVWMTLFNVGVAGYAWRGSFRVIIDYLTERSG